MRSKSLMGCRSVQYIDGRLRYMEVGAYSYDIIIIALHDWVAQ